MKTPITKCLLATKMFKSGQGLFDNWQCGNGFVIFHSDIWSQDAFLNQMGHFWSFAESFLSELNNIMSSPVFRFYYLAINKLRLNYKLRLNNLKGIGSFIMWSRHLNYCISLIFILQSYLKILGHLSK